MRCRRTDINLDFRHTPTQSRSHLIGRADDGWRRLDAGGVAIPPLEVFDQLVDRRGSVPIDSRDTLDPARRSLFIPFFCLSSVPLHPPGWLTPLELELLVLS